MRPLLKNYLDLSRFQNAPETDGINSAELDRLVAAAPALTPEQIAFLWAYVGTRGVNEI